MKTTDYSKAAIELIEQGMEPDRVLVGLRSLLKERGQSKLYPAVLRTMEHELYAYERSQEVVVRVCNESERAQHTEDIKAALARIDATEESTRTIEDQSVVGGFSVTGAHSRIDKTYKRQLLDLYRAVTN